LQDIQWQVLNYWQQKEKLPTNLEEIKDPLSGYVLPVDPVTKEPYTYERTANLSFKLCATFATEAMAGSGKPMPRPVEYGVMDENWNHAGGEVCFDRTIDPERYPPYNK
jgi:hypothetical protein